MVEFFQPLTKTSGMVLKFDPYGALMINRGNRISIVFHIFCCSMHKLSTIPLANVASLARFFMLAIWFKKLFKFFFSVFHLFISFTLGLPLWDTASMNMSYSPNKNLSYDTLTSPWRPPLHNGPLSSVPKVTFLERFDCISSKGSRWWFTDHPWMSHGNII